MMGQPCLLRVLLVSVFLVFCFSHGFGRQLMETVEFEDSTAQFQQSEAGAESREMIELMDYQETGPNTNPRAGYMFSPPPQG